MQTLHEHKSIDSPLSPVTIPEPQEEQRQAEELKTQPQAQSNRIVSKGAYMRLLGKKVALSSLSVGLLVAGGLAALLTLMMLYDLTGADVVEGVVVDKGWLRLWTPIGAGTCLLLLYLGVRALKQVARVERVVPLTRANTADLPAPDSLVRASSEPLQAEEAVLLRATVPGQETPPEQLVRASVGQE